MGLFASSEYTNIRLARSLKLGVMWSAAFVAQMCGWGLAGIALGLWSLVWLVRTVCSDAIPWWPMLLVETLIAMLLAVPVLGLAQYAWLDLADNGALASAMEQAMAMPEFAELKATMTQQQLDELLETARDPRTMTGRLMVTELVMCLLMWLPLSAAAMIVCKRTNKDNERL